MFSMRIFVSLSKNERDTEDIYINYKDEKVKSLETIDLNIWK